MQRKVKTAFAFPLMLSLAPYMLRPLSQRQPAVPATAPAGSSMWGMNERSSCSWAWSGDEYKCDYELAAFIIRVHRITSFVVARDSR